MKDYILYNVLLVVVFFGIVGIVFTACASKPLFKVQTKEVYIPIRCNLTLPEKPKEDGTFESHKALAIYYKKVEQIARDCVGE